MFRTKIQKLLKEITGREVAVEQPADPKNGDYSTNVAMVSHMDAGQIIDIYHTQQYDFGSSAK